MKGLSGFWGLGRRVMENNSFIMGTELLLGDENVLKLQSDDNCTTVHMLNVPVGYF